MYGLQEHEMRFYCLFKKVYFSLLATSDFFCRHAYAYAHMRIIRHESDMAAYAWPSLIQMAPNASKMNKHHPFWVRIHFGYFKPWFGATFCSFYHSFWRQG